jgi:hypothetical protein
MPISLSRFAQRLPGVLLLVLAVAVAALAVAAPTSAQSRDVTRLGVSVGGISTFGVIVEYETGAHSWELNVGTWSFRDLSASLIRRWRLSDRAVLPTVGLGLWGVVAWVPGERPSGVLVARAPIGVEWQVIERSSLTIDVNLNRALWVRRADPDDELPLNRRLVPLPGASWRWHTR